MACKHQLPDGSCPLCMSESCMAEAQGSCQEECDVFDEDL
jgi:hypothetical protein